MYPPRSFFCHLVLFLLAIVMVSAAPAVGADKYTFKVARRDDIVRRGTQTRPLSRRASPLPGQIRYAVFESYSFTGTVNTATNADSTQPSFGACARLCTATPDCAFLRYGLDTFMSCALRRGDPLTFTNATRRSAFRGLTCAEARARFPSLASATCVEEFY